MKIVLAIIMALTLITPLASAAHYVVGYVNNATDNEPANGKIVTLWNTSAGSSNNLTDIVGPTGNSLQDNFYLIDCELSPLQCQVGDSLTVKIFNNGSGYFTEEKTLIVTGAGLTAAENLTLQLGNEIEVTSVEVEDDLTFPLDEIDLTPASTKTVSCRGVLTDSDNETQIKNASAKFFSGNYNDLDDNNNHYSNDSCSLNLSYGDDTQIESICTFEIEYYADATTWNCTIEAYDVENNSDQNYDTTLVNSLLALGVDTPIDYGTFSANNVTNERQVNVTNYGNVQINLSLSGYGATINDGNSFNCTLGSGIPIYYEKYNLTASTPGPLTLNQFEATYTNLSSTPEIKSFNLNQRQNDGLNEAFNQTYWRTYVPLGTAGNCTGNIVFGATQGPGN